MSSFHRSGLLMGESLLPLLRMLGLSAYRRFQPFHIVDGNKALLFTEFSIEEHLIELQKK